MKKEDVLNIKAKGYLVGVSTEAKDAADLVRLCDLALQALEQGWQPIETAERGKYLLVGRRGWPMSFARTKGSYGWFKRNGDMLGYEPTHYYLLPEPPKLGGE